MAEFRHFLGGAGMRFLQPGDPAGGGVEEDPVPGLGCLDADPDREMGFPGAGRPEQDHVLGLGKEHSDAQMGDKVPVRGGLVVEVKLLEVLCAGNLAALIRVAAPEASRSETSRESTAARYSSCDQPASRAGPRDGGTHR